MNEPTFPAFALTGIIAAFLGPILGPMALVLFAAVMGGLLAMSKTPTPTRVEGIKFLAVGVGIAFVLTGAVVWAVERYTPIPGNIALAPVAFFIAAARGALLTLIDKAVEAAGNFLNALSGQKGNGQ